MTPYLQDPDLTIWNGDVREVLASLPDESVNCVVTSPPYLGLRDYGIEGTVWENEPYAEACNGDHEWSDPIIDRATNDTDKRRWQHTRNGDYCGLAAERIERWWKDPYPAPPEPLEGQLALLAEAS